jgi:hypothetical protein
MRKVVLTYGLIAGVILSAMLVVTLSFQAQTSYDKGAVLGYTTMAIAFLTVVFGVRS